MKYKCWFPTEIISAPALQQRKKMCASIKDRLATHLTCLIKKQGIKLCPPEFSLFILAVQ